MRNPDAEFNRLREQKEEAVIQAAKELLRFMGSESFCLEVGEMDLKFEPSERW